MVAAALGYRRDDQRISDLNKLTFAVRVDQPGRILEDFQTVEWKKDKRKVTYRDYLQDAVFVVALGSNDEALINQIDEALRYPRFQLFLGRRSNVPAGPLKIETFSDSNPVDALSTLKWQASEWYQKKKAAHSSFKAELFADAALIPNGREMMVKDRAESFDQRNRRFSFRAVTKKYVEFKTKTNIDVSHSEGGHDAMGAV